MAQAGAAWLARAAGMAVAENRPALAPGRGLGLCTQALPVHRRMSGAIVPARVTKSPTAQALVADVALTAVRMSCLAPGSGLGTGDHLVPFQCRMSVRSAWLTVGCVEQFAVQEYPAAHALLADVAVTAVSTRDGLPWSGRGTGTGVHLVLV